MFFIIIIFILLLFYNEFKIKHLNLKYSNKQLSITSSETGRIVKLSNKRTNLIIDMLNALDVQATNKKDVPNWYYKLNYTDNLENKYTIIIGSNYIKINNNKYIIKNNTGQNLLTYLKNNCQ